MKTAESPSPKAGRPSAATHLIVPRAEAPLDFDGGDGLHGVGAAQLVGGAVGEAHVLDLALVHQSLAWQKLRLCCSLFKVRGLDYVQGNAGKLTQVQGSSMLTNSLSSRTHERC